MILRQKFGGPVAEEVRCWFVELRRRSKYSVEAWREIYSSPYLISKLQEWEATTLGRPEEWYALRSRTFTIKCKLGATQAFESPSQFSVNRWPLGKWNSCGRVEKYAGMQCRRHTFYHKGWRYDGRDHRPIRLLHCKKVKLKWIISLTAFLHANFNLTSMPQSAHEQRAQSTSNIDYLQPQTSSLLRSRKPETSQKASIVLFTSPAHPTFLLQTPFS